MTFVLPKQITYLLLFALSRYCFTVSLRGQLIKSFLSPFTKISLISVIERIISTKSFYADRMNELQDNENDKRKCECDTYSFEKHNNPAMKIPTLLNGTNY